MELQYTRGQCYNSGQLTTEGKLLFNLLFYYIVQSSDDLMLKTLFGSNAEMFPRLKSVVIMDQFVNSSCISFRTDPLWDILSVGTNLPDFDQFRLLSKCINTNILPICLNFGRLTRHISTIPCVNHMRNLK